jgi:hypothetical protein
LGGINDPEIEKRVGKKRAEKIIGICSFIHMFPIIFALFAVVESWVFWVGFVFGNIGNLVGRFGA